MRLATVKVDLGATESTVSVTDRDGVLASFRRVPRAATSALTIEAVALVVQSAVEELAELERHPLVKPPDPGLPLSPPPVLLTPLELKAPVVPAGPPRGLGLELGALLGARTFAAKAPLVLGGGVVAALRVQRGGGWLPRVSLVAIYNGPFDVSGTSVEVSIQSVSLRALGGARWVEGRWAVELAAGLGADGLFPVVRSMTLDTGPRDRAEWSPIVTAMIGGRFHITPSTDLFLQLTGDLDLMTRSFVIGTNPHESLVETWRLRPAVLLGFSFDLVGL